VFYGLGFALAAVSTLFDPAKSALIPQILPRESLLAANGLSQTTRVVTYVCGEALAGLLVGLVGSGWLAFSLDSLSFFISAVFILRIVLPRGSAPPREPGPSESAWEALTGGLRFTLSQHLLVGVLVTMGVTMLGIGALSVLFIPFLTQEIHIPTALLGFVGIGQVAGMVLGSAVVSAFAGRLRPERMIAVGVAGMGLFTVLLGLTQDAWSFTLSMFCVGLCMTPVQAASATLVQQTVPDEKRGRVSSAMSTVITLASVISMGLAGILAGAAGIRTMFYLAGGMIAAAGLLGAVLITRPAPKLKPA
jgi:MFS family permease